MALSVRNNRKRLKNILVNDIWVTRRHISLARAVPPIQTQSVMNFQRVNCYLSNSQCYKSRRLTRVTLTIAPRQLAFSKSCLNAVTTSISWKMFKSRVRLTLG